MRLPCSQETRLTKSNQISYVECGDLSLLFIRWDSSRQIRRQIARSETCNKSADAPSPLFLLQLAMKDEENHFLMIEIHRAGSWNLPLPGEGGNLPER